MYSSTNLSILFVSFSSGFRVTPEYNKVSHLDASSRKMDKGLVVINYLAQNIDDLYQTKLYKLLFYIDFFHYRKLQKSITGNLYYKLPLGPVPLETKTIIDCMNLENIEDKSISDNIEKYKEYIEVDMTDDRKLIKSKKAIEVEKYISVPEKESIDTIIGKFGKTKSSKIVEISHKEPIYIDADMFDTLLYGYANTLLAV